MAICKIVKTAALASTCIAAASVAVPGAPSILVAYGIVCVLCSLSVAALFAPAAMAQTIAQTIAQALVGERADG